MNALFWCYMIYACSWWTSWNNTRQVYPHQHKWDELTRLLSLEQAAELIYYRHRVGVTWMMNVWIGKNYHNKTLYSLVFLCPYDLPTLRIRASREVCVCVCDLIVYISVKSPRVSVTYLLVYARKVTATVLPQWWFHEVIRRANGWIDSVTSVDAY